MNLAARGRRNAQAQNTIVEKLGILTQKLGVEVEGLDKLMPNHRDPAVRGVLQKEAMAKFLTDLVEALPSKRATRRRKKKDPTPDVSEAVVEEPAPDAPEEKEQEPVLDAPETEDEGAPVEEPEAE